MTKRKITIGIGGSSGSIYARQLLDKLSAFPKDSLQVGVVMSDNARFNWQLELGDKSYENYDFDFYAKDDFMAPFASGSAQYDTLIVCPCSMGLLARIASGISNDLVTRAADVILKERRKLILVPRDTPYNLIHIENMRTVTLAGGIICPASPSFYSKPETIEEVAATVVDRILDLADLSINTFRWGS
ncbi:MAG: UbiX family flavin prenyltransferase [Saprospiraceae bacterium]|nr:UbiX family flavin prenyltransferase [Saprospiraceae bacterium]